MKRYMLFSAVLLLLGMAIRSTHGKLNFAVILVVLTILAVFCIFKSKPAAFVLCVIIPLIGFAALSLYISRCENLSSPLYNTMCEAEGRVTEIRNYGDYAYMDMSVNSLKTCLGTYRERRKIRVYFYDNIPDIKYADIIKFKAVLREPTTQTMSGQNKKLHLLAKGICLTADCDADFAYVTGSDFSFFRPADLAHYIKNGICSWADNYFSGNISGLVKALMTGDKSGLEDEIYSAFKVCGLAHIVAVSGMHISILLGAAMFVMGIFGIKRRLAPIAVYIMLVWLFALVAGFSASAVRAAETVTIFYAAWTLNRESDALNSLGTAAIIILLANPASFYEIGFRLSVTSTAGILLFAKAVKSKIDFLPDAVADVLSVAFAAQLGCLPVIMYHFGSVSIISLLANLLICPVVPIIMILAVSAFALCKIPIAGVLLAYGLKILIGGVIYTVLILGSVPHASVVTGTIGVLGIIIYAAGLITLGLWLHGRSRKAMYSATALLALILCVLILNLQNPRAELAFLNVGSGDCAVFTSKDVSVMIDAGGSRDFDVAKTAIIPYMEKAGVSRIDFAFVSHYHFDHYGGCLTLMAEGKLGTLVLPEGIYENEMKDKLKRAAKLSNTALVYVRGGERIDCDGLRIEAFNAYTDKNENNGMVYYLDWGDNRVCFAGDIEESGEKKLCVQFAKADCDILKVAHHGSVTSTGETFLRAATPRYAVVSQKGAIPDKTRKNLTNYGADILSTYNLGTVVFCMDKSKIISIHSGRGLDNEL